MGITITIGATTIAIESGVAELGAVAVGVLATPAGVRVAVFTLAEGAHRARSVGHAWAVTAQRAADALPAEAIEAIALSRAA